MSKHTFRKDDRLGEQIVYELRSEIHDHCPTQCSLIRSA